MKAAEVNFTASDRLVMDSYKNLLDGLEIYLGNGYEIVLHSLENFEHSVVKIVNGHHTGRKIGAPITDLALAMLERINMKDSGEHIAYFTKNKKGEPLKATTIAIKGENNKAIGLLCINFYLNTPVSVILENYNAPANHGMALETFGESTRELITEAVKQTSAVVADNSAISPSLKNREIISVLHAQGIFKIKNAVELIAEEMSISRNTVYLHLRNINEGN